MEDKYKNGKIYKIVDIGYNKCYIGSTIDLLCKRMGKHRDAYKQYNNGKAGKTTAFELFAEYGIENCKIELVEIYPCNSRTELQAREGYHIKNEECVNKVICGRTVKEYRSDNIEYIHARAKTFRGEHKEEIQVQK